MKAHASYHMGRVALLALSIAVGILPCVAQSSKGGSSTTVSSNGRDHDASGFENPYPKGPDSDTQVDPDFVPDFPDSFGKYPETDVDDEPFGILDESLGADDARAQAEGQDNKGGTSNFPVN